jgi:hypothetical protein
MKLAFSEIKKKSKLPSIKCDWNTVYLASVPSLFRPSFLYFYNLFTFSTPDIPLSPPAPSDSLDAVIILYVCAQASRLYYPLCQEINGVADRETTDMSDINSSF